LSYNFILQGIGGGFGHPVHPWLRPWDGSRTKILVASQLQPLHYAPYKTGQTRAWITESLASSNIHSGVCVSSHHYHKDHTTILRARHSHTTASPWSERA